PQNAPKTTRQVQNLRNRNIDPTPRIRLRQCPTPRLTSRNSWTDQGRKEERREYINLENREIDNDIEEILDGNGQTDNKIIGTMGNNQHQKFHSIRVYPPMERQLQYQQATILVKDNEIQGNGS
ncbi:MAG: hypothetical protein EZS28_045175, partial [Streblomastix strix]